ncbi:hypothetical protein LRH25_06630 [Ideonella azotifigens]|uniref:Pilus assembly protein n=1 Tax=Ideonella azotifigens TaxID=513160 RepID=A0ABN1JP61_9BURK|nr:hypothetical protein [Ideonella azotifigens]MCD2340015.1 hypothetical protein [Ideonella azotifigens]
MTQSNQMRSRQAQRGQSIAEFLVALAVLTPLFIAVSYAGRYGDLAMTTTQASRYAAFQRAREPSEARLSTSKLEDQTRTRFFAEGDYLNKGRIQSDDTIAMLSKDKGQPALWRDLGGTSLLANAETDVTFQWDDAPVGTGAVTKTMGVMTKSAGKDYPPGRKASLEVKLVNKFNLSEDSPKPLVLAATTAAAGNPLNSGGSSSTRDAASTIVPTSKVPSALTKLLEVALALFEPDGPIIGCIKPDVVPDHRLDGGADNSDGQCK